MFKLSATSALYTRNCTLGSLRDVLAVFCLLAERLYCFSVCVSHCELFNILNMAEISYAICRADVYSRCPQYIQIQQPKSKNSKLYRIRHTEMTVLGSVILSLYTYFTVSVNHCKACLRRRYCKSIKICLESTVTSV